MLHNGNDIGNLVLSFGCCRHNTETNVCYINIHAWKWCNNSTCQIIGERLKMVEWTSVMMSAKLYLKNMCQSVSVTLDSSTQLLSF